MAEIVDRDVVLKMLRGFTPLQRVLLATAGTLQGTLSAFFGTPVTIGLVHQDEIDGRIVREVDLVCAATTIAVGHAMTEAQVTDPDILHVARAVAFTPATLEAIRADLDPVALMCTIPVVSGDAPTIAVRYETVADYLLLDSMDQGSGVVGATGLIHDWTVSARVVAAVEVPVVLAGGLGPENVGEAISVVHPWGVDSETRTSRTDDRRRKDLERVEAFVAAATGG